MQALKLLKRALIEARNRPDLDEEERQACEGDERDEAFPMRRARASRCASS